jgi:cystathionine beta-lyase
MSASPFDEIIERRSTHAYKWLRHDDSVLPLWVADADFKCPQPILDAIQDRVEHGVLGYHKPDVVQPLYDAVIRWMKKQYQWDIEAEWIVWIPGVVSAFNAACKAFCEPGDKVLVQTPNYGPMLQAASLNGLENLTVGTLLENDRWVLDFDELERKAADPLCKLFLFCNPMNPCGSVLTEAELKRIEAICLKHDVLLCSDEIHCDLILDESAQHIPAGTLSEIGEQAITIMAPSKTFNIAGLGASFVVIRDPAVRKRYHKATLGIMPWINVLGQVATIAAFTACDDWLKAQLDYLRGNRDYLAEELNRLEGFSYLPAQATFLAWVDAHGLGVDDVQQYMLKRGVGPSAGSDFGAPHFTRINFACPRTYLEQMIERLQA